MPLNDSSSFLPCCSDLTSHFLDDIFPVFLQLLIHNILSSADSTEAVAGQRTGHAERESEVDGGTASGEPEERGTDTNQTDGNPHTHAC